ncbi:ankyrin repeat and KH domain-containing protein 1 isoform X3 [Coccinella septempunctata]|uniref:ankyrin repeat and KH domain-containing protein 1 isoform X3 n=1 Tax=Coccinella septempunctata TaxID=41139 RepID=UPI001D076D7F|nr:ankyrin repeat and KH domain-containing protein 1 isoform X3 [Coccinella septempunctata]
MQNVSQDSPVDKPTIEKVNVQYDIRTSSTPRSTSNSSLAKSETETYSERRRYMSDSSESEEDSVSEVESFMIDQEFEEDPAAKFLLNPDEDRAVDPETQARLEALLQAAGIGQLAAKDGKHLADPEVLRRLTSSVSCALDEAAAALTRMRTDNPRCSQADKASLVEACTDGDVRTVQKLLTEGGRSVHETSEEGESLLSLACSAGYFELAQVLLAMHANVEDRGIKGECTPLMEAASAGHIEIVRLLVAHGADVNAQSTSGNTPLMYGCAGGHTEVVKFLLEHGANVEDHNENGHTPLMEAASAGHVGLAKLLLAHGAGINTHSNEFKESALTLACYKGHLDMVRFLLEAGADQEHKTDEMHTALMEASMDGHVEVARLLLDSGAQVNMPTDSFESPLTLAACGGHVDLAMLLIERGANIEEVNDEGYTPLMEAAREGHEEMVHLLLGQGRANINAQTDETQETALTLACCGGFTDVADILLKGGANIELGASTPLMEAAQEGHLDLVKFLLLHGANVEAQTQTGDTALTYACENGHTDVADLLLQYGANLEHESEGGRTPLMKACRAGHLCTVQFLISKGANVRKQTTNNDHTPLSLACAGGHMAVVELLLSQNADPNHKLKDNSTMLIEAAKGGHTNVVQLLLDFPHSIQSLALNQHQVAGSTTNLSIASSQISNRDQSLSQGVVAQNISGQSVNFFHQPTGSVLQEVPEAVRIIPQDDLNLTNEINKQQQMAGSSRSQETLGKKSAKQSLLPKSQSTGNVFESNLTSAEAQQPLDFEDDIFSSSAAMEFLQKEDQNSTLIEFIKNRKKHFGGEEGSTQKQQILEELHKVERELHGKQQPPVFQYTQEQFAASSSVTLPNMTSIDLGMQQQQGSTTCLQSPTFKLAVGDAGALGNNPIQPSFYFTPMSSSVTVSLNTATTSTANQPVKFSNIAHSEVKETTAVSDRPKAKPAKKEGKNVRKQQQQLSVQPNIYSQQLQIQQQNQFVSASTLQQAEIIQQQNDPKTTQFSLQTMTGIDLDNLDQESLVLKEETSENLLTASILQQFQNSTLRTFIDSNKSRIEYGTTSEGSDSKAQILNKEYSSVEEVVRSLDTFTAESGEQSLAQHGLQVQPYPSSLEESMIASIATQQDLSPSTDLSRVEYFVQSNGTQLPMHTLYPYEHYLTAPGVPNKGESGAIYQAGFQAGINLMSQHLACPSVTGAEPLSPVSAGTPSVGAIAVSPTQQYVNASKQLPLQMQNPGHLNASQLQSVHHYQLQHQQQILQGQLQQTAGQVQAATQTSQSSNVTLDTRKQPKAASVTDNVKTKKGRLGRHPNQLGNNFQQNQTYQIDPNSAITQYNNANNQQPCPNPIVSPSLDVDSETESNHDTALTLACAGGHEELVELLLNRGADIEHRDKKGFTPLILAATAGHEKVVDILLNHNADIEAQSERTKDTPLSLACSGGRYEVVEMLLKRNANKEHRNVSDYTPLSLAASGGYVNIIKLLLNHGAEINSRTGSKLGISPLMLAAMNGHTAAVKLLLDMGSDINAQIETNRNTALTLACFQGRHEVVSLLLDRKANVEHRAKTGLTPLMEAASGGYVEVGRVLLDKGADVNATPVPSSRDTALTIAADKGHVRFVELLLCRGALVEVKNKKGNSPLWLAANGGHLAVVELLYNVNADIDSQDNRKVSCLMAAFRKGHVKVVKWMVHSVTQFPSEQEMIRYLSTINDKDLMEKCQECIRIIQAAKETQAAKANKNATILLEELDMERTREESKKLAAARRRERKKKKKMEKKEEKRKLLEENKKNENYDDKPDTDKTEEKEDEECQVESPGRTVEVGDKEEGDSGIDANSQGSCSSNDIKSKDKRKDKKKKKNASNAKNSNRPSPSKLQTPYDLPSDKTEKSNEKHNQNIRKTLIFEGKSPAERDDFEATGNEYVPSSKIKKSPPHDDHSPKNTSPKQNLKREEGWKEVVRKSSVQTVPTNETGAKKVSVPLNAISRVIGRGGSNINAIRGATGAHIEVEKQSKGQGERIITLRGAPDAIKLSQTLIAALIKDPDVDIMQMLPKAVKTNPSTTTLWDKTQIGTKKATGKAANAVPPSQKIEKSVPTSIMTNTGSVAKSVPSVAPKGKSSFIVTNTRNTAPRLIAQAEKNANQPSAQIKPSIQNSSNPGARSSNKTVAANQSFAAKLTDASAAPPSAAAAQSSMKSAMNMPHSGNEPISTKITRVPTSVAHSSPVKHNRPEPTASAPPTMQHFQSPRKTPHVPSSNQMTLVTMSTSDISGIGGSGDHVRCTTPIKKPTSQLSHNEDCHPLSSSVSAHLEYSLFNSGDQQTMWRRGDESQKPVNFAAATGNSNVQAASAGPKFIAQDLPPQVDASKAPGYRGGTTSSPISSKTNSNSTTPPNMSAASYTQYHDAQKAQHLSHMTNAILRPQSSQNNIPNEMQATSNYYGELFNQGGAVSSISNPVLNLGKDSHLIPSYNQPTQTSTGRNQNYSQSTQPIVSMSRLNPKAPDFSSSLYSVSNKLPHQQQQAPLFSAYSMDSTNPMHFVPKGNMENYHRSGMVQTNQMPLMQLQQPLTQQQTELISGMATGLTLHNIARATGSEILENPTDLGLMNNSPNMSPNMAPLQNPENNYMDDRKPIPPQPIGTERARRNYNSSLEGNNWMMANDKSQTRWTNHNLDRMTIRGVLEPSMADTYGHGMQMDNTPNYSNTSSMPPFLQMSGPLEYVPPTWNANAHQSLMDDKQVSAYFDHILRQENPE